MPPMPQDIRDPGDDKQDAKVSGRTKRPRKAEGTLEDPKQRTRNFWPFKYSLEDNRWYVNRARRRVTKPEEDPALW